MYPRVLSFLPASAIATIALLSFHICASASIEGLQGPFSITCTSPGLIPPSTKPHTSLCLFSVASLGAVDAFILSPNGLERYHRWLSSITRWEPQSLSPCILFLVLVRKARPQRAARAQPPFSLILKQFCPKQGIAGTFCLPTMPTLIQ